MNKAATLELIKEQQWRWAFSHGIGVAPNGRVKNLDENVGKLYSLWSSSALLCNVFDYWRERTLAPLLTALSVQNSSYEQPGFEQTFRTGVRSARANVDVIFRACGSACLPVAIESKFTEPYQPGEKERLRPSYFQK